MKRFFIFATLLLLVSCEEKEKPVQFKIESETNYSFPAAMNTASFAITSNIPWQATLKNGGDWCSVTPASANGDGNVEIFVTENTAYTQERIANIVVTAGDFSKVITVTQAPPCPDFFFGSIASTGQAICSGDAVNTITSSTNASSGYGNISYEWRHNGTAIASANAATYSPSDYHTTAGVHTFTRWAKDDGCTTDWTQSAGQWVLAVNSPTITLLSGNANQIKLRGETIDTIKYTTVNATGTSLSSGALPAGITGSWRSNTYTISGAISVSAAIQTYNYTVTTSNSYGCPNVSASGTITVTTTPIYAASTRTWVFGTQTWSDAIHVPACNKNDYTNDYNNPQCRSYTEDGTTWYYYNWPYVNQNAAQLCPSPWRLPSLSDFSTLVSNTSGSVLISAWGLGGLAYGGSMDNPTYAYYWSSTQNGTNYAYVLNYSSGSLYVGSNASKLVGFQVRCVK
jgi:hypothetical protein